MPDIVIILVLGFPMLLFTVYPAIMFGDYLEKRFHLDEKKKRISVISATILITLSLSSVLFYA